MVNDNVAESHTLRASILEQLGRAEEVKKWINRSYDYYEVSIWNAFI